MSHHTSVDETLDGVAVIGMAGRFPGAPSTDALWTNLRNGVESISVLSDQELLASGADPKLLQLPNFVRAKGILDGVDRFDAEFFGYTPQEAMVMDPQHRIFLECGWHALENAGYCGETYPGAIGVFAGANFNQYVVRHIFSNPAGGAVEAFDKDFLSTRLSYKLNLRGPSLVVQTACSTSLVAVAQACQSLLTYQCDMAVAGGIAIHLPMKYGYLHYQGGILSPDGHCRAFDAKAHGTVVSSGVGLVVLKRLADAVADGDTIRAVIRGFALNNDGSAKMGYTAPSIDGQAQVIAMALALAGVDAESIGCVEAHGTGTELGDPIEVAALTQAYRATTRRTGFCALGSLKTNIGHLDSAAGVAGLIKTTLMLEHKEIPPSLHFEQPNPKIDFASSPFFVNTRLTPWERGATPRRAGVSSFGIGGTNVHMVLEEAPLPAPATPSSGWHVLPLSARTPAALATATENLAQHLERNRDLEIADVAFTLQAGRKSFKCRRAVVCSDIRGAIASLRASQEFEQVQGAERPVVFAFPDEADPSAADLRDSYASGGVFREAVNRCLDALAGERAAGVRRVFAGEQRPDESPAIRAAARFAFQYALAQLFADLGIRPAALVGEGTGELTAACVSGSVSLPDAVHLLDAARSVVEAPAGASTISHPPFAVRAAAPQVPSFSLRTGARLTQADASDAALWTRRLRASSGSPVALPPNAAGAIVLMCGPGEALEARLRAAAEHAPAAVVAAGGADGAALATVAGALGRLWTAGAQPDWMRLHAGARRYRVALPGYPFEQQRYWVEREPASAKKTLLRVGALQHDDFAEWFHVLSWKRSAAPVRAVDAAPERCLVFADDSEVCERLVGRMIAAGCAVIRVRSGTRFVLGHDSTATVNPSNSSDYVELIARLAAGGSLPSTIVHAWGLSGRPEPDPDDRAIDRLQQTGFYSLLYLAQAIGSAGLSMPLRILAVTDGVHEVVGGEPLVPEKATVAGPCRVIPQEFPGVQCRLIDLRIGDAALDRDQHLDAIVAEILSPARDAVVAYRGGRRWIQVCDGVRLEAVPDESHPRLKSGAAYLITGGLGGVGLTIAEHLAGTYKARLILTCRGGLPARAEWDAILAASSDAVAVRRIRGVRKLEALGAEVMVAAADVSDEARMRAVIAEARARFGRIDGVIHAAGVAGGGVIQLKKPSVAAAVLTPKVNGTRVLARIFKDHPPPFLLLCSSMTSLVGGFGQVDYCGANAYLDTFARQFAEQTGAYAVSVNWNAWREVGMAVDTAMPEDVRDEYRSAILSTGLTNRQGIDAVVRILGGCTEPQIAVSPNDLALLGLAASMADDQRLSAAERPRAAGRPAPNVTRHPRPTLQTPFVAPRTDIERQLCEIWQELLGIDRIGVHDNFFDLGGHSLLAIRVMARVNAAMKTNLPVARLYDGLTVEFLATLEGEPGDTPGAPDDGADDDDRRRDRLRRQREQQARRREAMSRT